MRAPPPSVTPKHVENANLQRSVDVPEPQAYPESLQAATLRFGAYLALGVSWYVRAVPGPAARPLNIEKRSAASEAVPTLPRTLTALTNRQWLHEKPFRVVLGAGFVGGLYRQLGFLIALNNAGLRPQSLVGVSAGAIVGSMYGVLPLLGDNSVESSLMTLHPQDFLDPEWATLVQHGAVCSGHAFERKLHTTFAPSGKSDLSQTEPPVSVQIYDTHTGITSLPSRGDMVQAVRWSASLPVLFASHRNIDGGWVDQNGLLGMTPGERAINHRIYDGDGARSFMEWRIARPTAVYAPRKIWSIAP